MLPWKTILELKHNLTTPIYLQIANGIVKLISRGNLMKGQKMPGTRRLSDLLKINRKTVIHAYEELIAQGWMTNVPSKGTFITEHLPVMQARPLMSIDENNSSQNVDFKKFDFIAGYSPRPKNILEINDGSPDHRLAPTDWIYKECRSLAKSNYGKNLLKYADIKGDETLRIELAKYLSETRGLSLKKENILITRGSQMGIFLLLSTFIRPGDIVIVGDTSYDAADWCIMHHGGHLERIEVDENGLNIEKLSKFCASNTVKAVYITPHHHFPTTVTLTNERRIRLLELSFKHNFAIIEDDYDYDFHYKSSPLLPLASLNHRGHVAYVGSFSKIFAPSIRVGYVAASSDLIEELSKVRRIIDRQGDQILERVMAETIVEGELQRHLKKTLKEYLMRRDIFCQFLKYNLGDYSSFKVPEGGMAIWSHFNNDIDLYQLLPDLKKAGLFLNIDKTYIQELNCLRLGFASVDKDEIKKAIHILTETIKQPSS